MRRLVSTMRVRILGLLFCTAMTTGPTIALAEPPRPVVKVVTGGESKALPEQCLTTIIGPGVNQPDPYPGYGGFVGWVSPIRLKSGDWLIGFSAGYWHASAPTPLRFSEGTIAEYRKIGLPADVVAPTGGRAMMIRSTDEGKTWSKPATMLETPDDDRHPAFVELRDGTLVSLHGSYVKGGLRLIFSTDGGQTWIAPAADHGFLVDNCYGYGKAVEFPDGTLLVADQGTGGHTTADARNMSLRLLRVRIRPDHSGIDLLPATNR